MRHAKLRRLPVVLANNLGTRGMMAEQLNVDTDVAFNTAHAVRNDAEELREELSGLSWEWDNVAHGWSGAAASTFTPIWEEWHEGAATLVETLADSSQRLAKAAVLYEEQDSSSAQSLGSLPDEMNL